MLFARRRVLAMGIVLVITLALLLLAIVVPADPSFRQTLVAVGNSSLPPQNVSAQALVSDIVKNNMRVALLEAIPAFGFFFLPLSVYASGVIIQGFALSANPPVSPSVAAFSYVLLPFTYVELSAYAVAFVSGTMLLVAWGRKRLRLEVRVFVLELVAIAIILIVAAVMETTAILSPLVGVLLWVPLLAVMVPLILRIRRSKS
jgi:hypothetical protein